MAHPSTGSTALHSQARVQRGDPTGQGTAGARRYLIGNTPVGYGTAQVPSVPSFPFEASDGVRVVSDAGSIMATLQIVYEPKSKLSDAPSTGPLQEVRRLFDLRIYDHRANRVSPDLQRAWVLEVPALGLSHSFEDPSRLIIARHEDNNGWVPLVTSYQPEKGLLQARILEFGLFAVIHESKAITG